MFCYSIDLNLKLVKTNQSHEGKNMQKHSCNVVYTLQSKLANVSKDFKNVLEVRNEVSEKWQKAFYPNKQLYF